MSEFLQSSPPIARLPSETLAEIFECAIAQDQTEFSSHDVQLRHIVSVCRHWHTVAMAYPRLWTALVFTSVEITALMIQRSKECSLMVKADFRSAQRHRHAIALALTHLSRIRVLHLLGLSKDFHNSFIAAMDGPAPLLESLRLTWNDAPEHDKLPSLLFADVTPRLRHFAVHHVPWSLPLLHDLTHLEIHGSTLTPSMAEFHRVLSRCLSLDTLILVDTLPAASDRLQPPVSLPRLSHLHLAGPLAGCDVVIHSISFPKTTAVTIRSRFGSHPQLLRLLTNLRDMVSTTARLCLILEVFSTRIQAWTTAEPVSIERPSLDLSFAGSRDTSFPIICERLTLTQLVNLEVEVFSLARDVRDEILSTLNNLRVLTIHGKQVRELVPALTPLPGQAIPFPALRELTLHGTRFLLSDMRNLQACLIRRRDNNAEIEKLKLFGWMKLPKASADRLRESLGDGVDWDGVELVEVDASEGE
jgi:hypothetical protein